MAVLRVGTLCNHLKPALGSTQFRDRMVVVSIAVGVFAPGVRSLGTDGDERVTEV